MHRAVDDGQQRCAEPCDKPRFGCAKAVAGRNVACAAILQVENLADELPWDMDDDFACVFIQLKRHQQAECGLRQAPVRVAGFGHGLNGGFAALWPRHKFAHRIAEQFAKLSKPAKVVGRGGTRAQQ